MIRWLKMKAIAEKIIGMDIHITATTLMEKDLRGICMRDGNYINIIINLSYAKNEDDVILTMAHELAHLKVPIEHNNIFYDNKNNIYKKLIKLMEREVQKETSTK